MNKEILDKFRKNWKTKGGRELGLKAELTEKEILEEAYKRSYAPAVKHALKKPKDINLNDIRNDEEFKKKFITSLEEFLKMDEKSDFKKWEEGLASFIREKFHDKGVDDWTYGNSQKWINMAIKYLLSCPKMDGDLPCFQIAYIPIDGIILEKGKKMGVKKLSSSWSKCDDIDKIDDYEKSIQEMALRDGYSCAMEWEIKNW